MKFILEPAFHEKQLEQGNKVFAQSMTYIYIYVKTDINGLFQWANSQLACLSLDTRIDTENAPLHFSATKSTVKKTVCPVMQ